VPGKRAPMCAFCNGCCARATTGHAAALPSVATNCRRVIRRIAIALPP